MPLVLLPRRQRPLPAKLDPVGGGPAPSETDLDRFLKLIPTEVATAYISLAALGAPRGWPYYDLALTVLGLIAVVLVLRRDGRIHSLPVNWRQHVVRCLAFLAWAFAVRAPLEPWLDPDQGRWVAGVAASVVPLAGYFLIASSSQPTSPNS